MDEIVTYFKHPGEIFFQIPMFYFFGMLVVAVSICTNSELEAIRYGLKDAQWIAS